MEPVQVGCRAERDVEYRCDDEHRRCDGAHLGDHGRVLMQPCGRCVRSLLIAWRVAVHQRVKASEMIGDEIQRRHVRILGGLAVLVKRREIGERPEVAMRQKQGAEQVVEEYDMGGDARHEASKMGEWPANESQVRGQVVLTGSADPTCPRCDLGKASAASVKMLDQPFILVGSWRASKMSVTYIVRPSIR